MSETIRANGLMSSETMSVYLNLLGSSLPKNVFIQVDETHNTPSRRSKHAQRNMLKHSVGDVFLVFNRGIWNLINESLSGHHWVFAIITKAGKVIYGDPLKREAPENLLEYVQEYFKESIGRDVTESDIINVSNNPNFPSQSDGVSCGFTVILIFMLAGCVENECRILNGILTSTPSLSNLELIKNPASHIIHIKKVLSVYSITGKIILPYIISVQGIRNNFESSPKFIISDLSMELDQPMIRQSSRASSSGGSQSKPKVTDNLSCSYFKSRKMQKMPPRSSQRKRKVSTNQEIPDNQKSSSKFIPVVNSHESVMKSCSGLQNRGTVTPDIYIYLEHIAI